MGFIHVAVAVLSFLSVGHSAPVTTCESLTQTIQLQGREQLLGKWMIMAESTNIPGSKLLTKMFVHSAWVKITAGDNSDDIRVVQSQKMFGRCFTITTNMTLKNSTLSMVKPTTASEVFLNTRCPDCLVIYSKYNIGESLYNGLQLLSRRNNLSAVEIEDFTKQGECLGLPSPAVLDLEKGSCPDDTPSQETESTDLTSSINEKGQEIFDLFDRIISSDNGINRLVDILNSGAFELKEN